MLLKVLPLFILYVLFLEVDVSTPAISRMFPSARNESLLKVSLELL